jgi:methylglyoxal synthase
MLLLEYKLLLEINQENTSIIIIGLTNYSAISYIIIEQLSSKGIMMEFKRFEMGKEKKIALIAHDNKKADLLEWARFNKDLLAKHKLFATGTTGQLLASHLQLEIYKFKSGPLGGDQQVGAKIVDGEIDFVIFFWDPLEPQPHDVDVKALLRVGAVYNIPIACNRSSADFMISSPLMSQEYDRLITDNRGNP